jgi:hypothetical protein
VLQSRSGELLFPAISRRLPLALTLALHSFSFLL